VSEGTFIQWAVAGRPMPGEDASGDAATVQTSSSRCVLAVIDGLGHGADAAAAATVATGVVEQYRSEPLMALFLLAHEKLAESRGVAATVAIVDGDTGRLDWLGVGNVNGVVLHADEDAKPRTHGVFLHRGVLGYLMPKLHLPEPLQLADGDFLVLATDGVRGDLTAGLHPELPVDRLAEAILADQATPDDDALVLVARFRGGPGRPAGPPE
jgi:negative regulator of sigma-B (phosphoserine phosphatase)